MITIKKPKEVKKLITCINAFNPDVQFNINKIGCGIDLITEINARMRLKFKTNLITSDKDIKLNLRDIQRFKQAIQLVEDSGEENIQFKVSEDETTIFYNKKGLKFKLHTVDEIAIAKNIDSQAFPELTQSFGFKASSDKIKYLFKQSAMVRSDTIKIYLVNECGTIISAQLEDRTTKHSGVVAIPLAESFDGVFEPVILSMTAIKSLIILPSKELHFIRSTAGVILVKSSLIFDADGDDVTFIDSQILFSPVH